MNTRHLSVVMFTDIQGYTQLMQTDESAAMKLRARHREVFEAAHEQFNGTVIQYFGDGTLSTFKSSNDAVECDLLVSDVTRTDGAIVLTLLLPIKNTSSDAAKFPEPILNAPDGDIEVPA